VPPNGTRHAFIKLGRRNAQAISRLAMAAAGRLDALGRVDYVHLAPGAAMPRTQRFPEVENLLLGQVPTDDLFAAAGAKTAEVMIAVTGRRWSTEYKENRHPGAGRTALRQGVAVEGATMLIEFTLNGNPVAVDAPPDITLLALLRDHLGLTGAKEGCGGGRVRRLLGDHGWAAGQ